MSKRWHILREDAALTVARRLPLRFDFTVERRFPRCSRLLLASQIRQDMWRAFQNLKGFAPVVRVEAEGDELRVTAGGQVDGAFPRARSVEKLAALLDESARRDRWISHAGRRHHA